MNSSIIQVQLELKIIQDEIKGYVVEKPMVSNSYNTGKIYTCYWEFQLLSSIFAFGVLASIQLYGT